MSALSSDLHPVDEIEDAEFVFVAYKGGVLRILAPKAKVEGLTAAKVVSRHVDESILDARCVAFDGFPLCLLSNQFIRCSSCRGPDGYVGAYLLFSAKV